MSLAAADIQTRAAIFRDCFGRLKTEIDVSSDAIRSEQHWSALLPGHAQPLRGCPAWGRRCSFAR